MACLCCLCNDCRILQLDNCRNSFLQVAHSRKIRREKKTTREGMKYEFISWDRWGLDFTLSKLELILVLPNQNTSYYSLSNKTHLIPHSDTGFVRFACFWIWNSPNAGKCFIFLKQTKECTFFFGHTKQCSFYHSLAYLFGFDLLLPLNLFCRRAQSSYLTTFE